MQQKKLKIWLPFLFGLCMAVGMYFGFKIRDAFPEKQFFSIEKRNPLEEALTLIENKYVDEVDIDHLTDTAIQAILIQLDPHSQFIPAKEVEAAIVGITGNFYGIGIEFDILKDTLHVLYVFPDGPADNAGMKVGDKLLKAGDSLMAGQNRDADEMRTILKGNRGSILQLELMRNGEKVNVEVERDMVSVSSIEVAYMIEPNIGFIRLNRFTQQSYREFMESLTELKEKGMTKLILDLRGNGGGVLEEAVEIADEFLSGDKLITYTEGFHSPRKDYRCRRVGQFETGELVVLSDEASASASEILMGALQDWDRATIVGRRSFGKGLVQEQYRLTDGSALRLTVSRYYTPLGRSIQKPYSTDFEDYYAEVAHRVPVTDSALVPDSVKPGLAYKTPSGKLLYAGGGITPDHRIGGDTTKLGFRIAAIFERELVQRFGYLYTLEHRDSLKKYKTPAAFNAGFTITPEVRNYFNELAALDTVNTEYLNPVEETFLYRMLKLTLARNLWRNEGFYAVENKNDEIVQEALSIIKSKTP